MSEFDVHGETDHRATGRKLKSSTGPAVEYVTLGLFCILVGGGAMTIAREYPYGTLIAMGPGFMPTAVSILLVFLGCVILLLRGTDVPNDSSADDSAAISVSRQSVRMGIARAMFFVLGGIIFFGLALRGLGLAISTFVLVLVVSLAQRGARPLATVMLAAAVTAAACIIFVVLLRLQIPLFPRM